MKNPLIGLILHSLLKEYDEGACDNISKEELDSLIKQLSELKDSLELKQDATMTTEEVSLYLGVTRLTVNNYIKEDLLHPKKLLGGVLLFKKKEVKLLIKKLKQ